MRAFLLSIFCVLLVSAASIAQDHSNDSHAAGDQHGDDAHHSCECHEAKYDPGATAFHHISDANAFHLFGRFYFPLPAILYAPGQGWSFFLSNKFGIDSHGDGKRSFDGYVLHHGEIMRVAEGQNFDMQGEVEVECFTSTHEGDKEIMQVIHNGECYNLDKKSTLDGGVFGGGITSYYDFSITKNVFTMLLTFAFLFWLFRTAALGYKKREGKAPKGVQSFLEPIFTFIRDDVAIPFLGKRYEDFLPFLMAIFFFILGLNLIGQIPFFPGSGNVTGNLAVTMTLALFTFIITTINGNKHYWEHIFWMPGIPAWVKIILTPVEIIGVFIKPLTLMLRLFANITAGHIVIIIFVSLIFIFGNAGANIGGAALGGVMAVPLTLFMMSIEVLVAVIQAFVFCILTASYIGAAIEEPHHH